MVACQTRTLCEIMPNHNTTTHTTVQADLRTWPYDTLMVGGSRITLRLAPEHAGMKPLIVGWLQNGIETQPEFRRSRHSVVHRLNDAVDGHDIFLKRFLLRDAWDYIKRLYRPPRARSAVLANQTINHLGFRTEPMIALAEYRRFGLITQSVMITREIKNVYEVRSMMRDPEHGLRSDIARRRKALAALGHEIGLWHKSGLHHGDLRLSNVLVRVNGDEYIFYWMDNERTRRYARLPRRLRIHNLVQIITDPHVFSRTDMLRLWKAYKQSAEFHDPDEKDFIRTIIARTQKKRRARNWM